MANGCSGRSAIICDDQWVLAFWCPAILMNVLNSWGQPWTMGAGCRAPGDIRRWPPRPLTAWAHGKAKREQDQQRSADRRDAGCGQPFEGSKEVRKLFPHSVLLAEPGCTTHADSLFGDLCVDGTIAKYLVSGKLPPRKPGAQWDKTCKPLPRPVPTGSSARNASASSYSAVLSQLRGLRP